MKNNIKFFSSLTLSAAMVLSLAFVGLSPKSAEASFVPPSNVISSPTTCGYATSRVTWTPSTDSSVLGYAIYVNGSYWDVVYSARSAMYDKVGGTQIGASDTVVVRSVYANGESGDAVATHASNCNSYIPANSGCAMNLSKTANKQNVDPGGTITYTITLSNGGVNTCTGGGVWLQDPLPPGVTFVSQSHAQGVDIDDGHYLIHPDEVYDASSNTLNWNAHHLQPGETVTVSWVGQVSSSASACTNGGGNHAIYNQARATSVENNVYTNQASWVNGNGYTVICGSGGGGGIDTNGSGGSDTSGGSGTSSPAPLTAGIVGAPNPSTVGNTVNWTISISGGTGPYTYSVTGTDGLSVSGQTSSTSFNVPKVYTAVGNKTAQVTISSADGQTVTAQAVLAVQVNAAPLSSVTCTVSPTTVNVSEEVTWSCTPNPAGNYSYSWTGDDGASGTALTLKKSYTTVGVKHVSFDVVGQGANPDWTGAVTVSFSPHSGEF